MVARRYRSTGSRRRVRRSSTGKQVIIYKNRRAAPAICAICDCKLNAVPRGSVVEMRKLAKTEKRPERVFGGVLCHACTQQIVKEKVRIGAGVINRKDVPLMHLKYVEMLKL